MANPNTTYHPLGDYIRKVDKRNRKLTLTKPMGINIDKLFHTHYNTDIKGKPVEKQGRKVMCLTGGNSV